MKKLAACALLVLGLWGENSAQAQFAISRPPTFGGPPGFPLAPYYGGFFGYGYGPGVYGQGTYAPPSGPAPNAPGYSGQSFNDTGRSTASRATDPNQGNNTGHPTRFLYYGHYFLNQGGGTTSPQSLTSIRPPEAAGLLIGGEFGRGTAGTQPTRPQSPRRR